MNVILKILWGISIGALSIFSSCKKSSIPEDPEMRNFRKDIFNCLVNEKRWDPAQSESGYVKAYVINSGNDEYFVNLIAGSANKTIVIHLTSVKFSKGSANYSINQNVPQNVLDIFVFTMHPESFAWFDDWWIDDNNFKWHKGFLTSAEKKGEVTITKFTMEPAPVAGTYRGIIAGSFYFKALHSSTNETINVRAGSFEIEYWK